jgi:recombination associated protein RdgC
MQLLSSTLSLTRYSVVGEIADPVMETVRNGLKDHMIREIDNDPAPKSVGWTLSDNPFTPDFETADFVFGASFIFSLRIDKKSIPAKIINKHYNMAVKKRLAGTEREHLSKNEKREIKDEVLHQLYVRIPASPGMYDLVWHYEAGDLWFFSNMKEANEELETLFSKSFKVSLTRIFPYTAAQIHCSMSPESLDALHKVSPSVFNGGPHA